MMGEHTGVAIMAYVAPEQAKQLAIDGGEAPEDLHVTLDYLAEDAVDVGAGTRALFRTLTSPFFGGRLPLTANAYGRAEFNFGNSAEDERPPCSLLLVQSDHLLQAHDIIQHVVKLTPHITSANSFPIWVPHISLGYNVDVKSITSDKLGPVKFDRIAVSWGGELQYL